MRRRIATVRGTDHHWEYPVQNEEDGREAGEMFESRHREPSADSANQRRLLCLHLELWLLLEATERSLAALANRRLSE
jgi:hypothetical protein